MTDNSTDRPVRRQDVHRDYAALAPHYETRWRKFNAVARNWVLANWPEGLDPEARVVDLGCGAGGFLAAVAERYPRTRLTGLDITPHMLARASEAVPKAALVEANAVTPPLRARAFDVVCSLNILHHLDDPAAHVAAMTDLARPGGTVFLCTFSGDTPAERMVDFWLRWRNPAWRGMVRRAELRAVLAGEPRLRLCRHACLGAGIFWRLQLYRLAAGPG